MKDAQTAALKTARPGVPLESIDAAARKVVVDAGYGPGFKYFSATASGTAWAWRATSGPIS